jgi:hypothetical protein
LILSDVGATIQILGLIGKEDNIPAERPGRMSECLACLDVSTWFDAISARTFPSDSEHSSMTAIWKHCRLVAQYAQLVAESLNSISSEDAYLVGLLHEIGTIATVLGWPDGKPGRNDQSALLAIEGALPLFVLAAMRSVNDPGTLSTWRFILTAAHELAGSRPELDASALQSIDSMGICFRWGSLLPLEAKCSSEASAVQRLGAREAKDLLYCVKPEPSRGVRLPVPIQPVAHAPQYKTKAPTVKCRNQSPLSWLDF